MPRGTLQAPWGGTTADLRPASRRNILPNISTAYLKSCVYDAHTDPFCPIFRLGQVVESAGHSFQDMAVEVGTGLAVVTRPGAIGL